MRNATIPKPIYPPEAVQALLALRTRLVLLEPWGRLKADGSQVKKPAHRNWRKQSPGFPKTAGHVAQDGLLGVVPSSLAAVVMDVDRGEAAALIAEFPPWFVARSQKAGRYHIWYLNPSGLTPPAKRWTGPGGTGGEAVHDFPYVVMWGDSMQLLADAVADLNEEREGMGTDFRLVAQGLTWKVNHPPAPAAGPTAGNPTGRGQPSQAPDLNKSRPGHRNADVFDYLRAWAYAHWRIYTHLADFHLELEELARTAHALIPDSGPGPDGDAYTEADALATARSVATGVWEYKVTGQRKRAEIGQFLDSGQESGALRADSRPPSRGGQSWESWETETAHGLGPGTAPSRDGGLGEQGYRGDPALNADSDVQSYRRGCRTTLDQLRVDQRRGVVANRFAAGQPVATLAGVFGVTRRTIRRDLASVGELPSKRIARRKLQADGERARREKYGTQGGLGYGEGVGRVATGGTKLNQWERETGERGGQETNYQALPSQELSSPPTPDGEGCANAPPPDYGLVSDPGQARDGPEPDRAFQATCPHASLVTRAKNQGESRTDILECRTCHIHLRWVNTPPRDKFPDRAYFNDPALLRRGYPKVMMASQLRSMGFTDGTIRKYLGEPDEWGYNHKSQDTNIPLWHVKRAWETIGSNPELESTLARRKATRLKRRNQGQLL